MEVAVSLKAHSVKFVTNKMCPYAQRTWIALEESRIPYNLVEVSLYGARKPDWFMKLNPKGEVPVLDVDGTPVIDSENTLDYIAENFAPSLAPVEYAADIAAFRNLVNGDVKSIGRRTVQGDSRGKGAGGGPELSAVLCKANSLIAGPYVCGESFTIADACAVPFFWRIKQEFGFPEDCSMLSAWMDACEERPSVKATLVSSWWWWW